MSSVFFFFCLCFLASSVSVSRQHRPADVTVTCSRTQDCLLPCSFTPDGQAQVRWFHQDVEVYSSEPGAAVQSPRARRAWVAPAELQLGNATLLLRNSGLKDRGRYTCRVRTSAGEQRAAVVLKVEAPLRGVSLELSRLSGYEEFRCSVRSVFPAPRVTWATEPPTFEDLRPMTRVLADPDGLFSLDSRLRRLDGQPDLVYICRVSTSYGGPAWTASLRERELRGQEGQDLTVPCLAPPSINAPAVSWSFSGGSDPSRILSYDSVSGRGASWPPWDAHVELDGFRVPFGDASLRLMNPGRRRHSGSYTCVLSVAHNSHTERSSVAIEESAQKPGSAVEASHWWILGLVVAVLVLALAAMLVYLKLRGNPSTGSRDPEEVSELHPVKEPASQGEGAGAALGVQSGSC
ncbi:uncharacterized protein ACB058_021707 isoform 2-T3 [Synchiropus picturatus]